jgi:hypothetical protein
MTHALATQSVSSRLRYVERSVVAGRVIHGPEFAVGARRAVGGDLRPLAVVWVFGDEREPALGVSETQEHSSQRSIGGASLISVR